MCTAGTYAPLLDSTQKAYAWLDVQPFPAQMCLRNDIVLPSAWDVSFDVMMLEIFATARRSIFGLATQALPKLLSVSQPVSTSLLEVAVTDAAGTTKFVSYAGYGPTLTLGTWNSFTLSRRGDAFYIYWNGAWYRTATGLSNTSAVSGVSLLVRAPASITPASIAWPAANCSIRNLVYQPMATCIPCSAGTFSTALGSTS